MTDNRQGKLLYRLKALFVSVTMVVFTVWAATHIWASIEYKNANTRVQAMVVGGAINSEVIQAALTDINQALRFFPTHPDYLELKGQILEFAADQPGLPVGDRMQYLEQAAEQHRAAISRQPMSPHSWSSLLAIKEKLGNIDGEYLFAFERSVELGPGEPQIQLQLIRSGLSNWPQFGVRQQNLISEAIDRAIQNQTAEMFMLIRKFDRPDLVCVPYPENPRIQRYCNQVRWSRF